MDRCVACGAPLTPELGWCPRCLAQAPPSEEVLPPWIRRRLQRDRPEVLPTTRWHATPTTMGPALRVASTVLVALVLIGLAFTPLLIAWFPALIVGAVLLREIWRPGYVGAEPRTAVPRGAPTRPARPPAPIEIPTSTKVAWGVGGVLAAGLVIAWLLTDRAGHGVIGISLSLAALVVFVVWAFRG